MQVSHSRVECYRGCPYRYKLRYIDNVQIEEDLPEANNPLLIGTALHNAIENGMEFAEDEYYSNYYVVNDRHYEEMLKIEYYLSKVNQILPNKGQHEVMISTPEYIGFIDLLVPVDENVYDIYDFKYSNAVEHYMESPQLHLYKYYFEQMHPEATIRNLFYLFVPKVAPRMKKANKTNKFDETPERFRIRLKETLPTKEVQLVKVDYDESMVIEFQKNIEIMMSDTTFCKTNNNCKWCEFKKICEGDYVVMKLPSIQRREVKQNPYKKLWFYGAPFSGKTYLANKFDTPLMLNTDGNIKFVDAPAIPIKDEIEINGRLTNRVFAWATFKDAIDELEMGSEFKTIIVDLVEDIYEHCRLYMYDQLGIKHESDDSFRAWDKVRQEFLSTMKKLLNLPYNIILISHEDTSKDLAKKSGDKITAIKPNINDKLAGKLAGMVDICCRVVNDEGNRYLNFKSDEVTFGGGRLSIETNTIPCDYNKLCELYDKSMAKLIEQMSGNKTDETVNVAVPVEEANETTNDETTTTEKPKRRSRRSVE